MEKPEPPCPGCRALEERVKELERKLDEALRAAKRQSAPFSRGAPKREPLKCGRKADDGQGWRRRGIPKHVDVTVDVPLPSGCPCCGEAVHEDGVEVQYKTEIPAIRPHVTQFDVHVGHCSGCGERVQGRHPDQSSQALGAAGNHLGPNAIAIANHLHSELGLSFGKVQAFFASCFGLESDRTTWVRRMLSTSEDLAPVYNRIEIMVRGSERATVDETSWRIAGLPAWLHAFATEEFGLYKIAESRGHEVPAAVLGLDYDGLLIHDGFATYDKFKRAIHQTCIAHLLRRAERILSFATRGAVRFPREVKRILKDAIALRDRHAAGNVGDHGLAIATGRLDARIAALGEWRLSHEENRRFQRHILAHRDQVLTFLHVPGVEATNWRAEHAIRPAVVNRKVWGGNRTDRGARAQEILMSVIRSLRLQGRDVIGFLREFAKAVPDPALVPAWAGAP